MNEFRARWPERSGVILSLVGFSLGMGVMEQLRLSVSGVQLLAWLVALTTLILPAVALELAMGTIFQGGLAECLRKSDKRLEVLGWLSCFIAFVALVAAAATVAKLCILGYDSLLATFSDQSLPWAARLDVGAAAFSGEAAVPVALAAVLAFIDVRLWRGAPSIARTAVFLVPVGLAGLAVLLLALAIRPGAIDGMARWLMPDGQGWGALLDWHTWCAAYAYALATWLPGLGIYAAVGSYLNRSSDVTGITCVAVLGTGLCQLLLMLVVAVATGLAWSATATGAHDISAATVVPAALANLALAPWQCGVLSILWFAALIAFALPALLALAEGVVAPIVDKFRVQRERVVAWVCLAAFFCAAIMALPHAHLWQVITTVGLVAAASLLTAALALAGWWRLDLFAVQRHLNAYSAFRVGLGWRFLIGLLVPCVTVVVAVSRFATLNSGVPVHASNLGSYMQLAVGSVVFAVASAVVVARLPARGT